MKAQRWGVGLVLLAGGFLLAGEESPYERTTKQLLKNLEEIGTILKTIEAEEDANAAKPKLRKEADSWIAARAKAATMQQPEREEKLRLTRLYKLKFDDAIRKLTREIPRVEAIPGGKEALKEINGVLKKDGKE